MKGPYRGYSELWFALCCFLFKRDWGVRFLKNASSVSFQIPLTSAPFFSKTLFFFLLIMTTLESIFYPNSSMNLSSIKFFSAIKLEHVYFNK